MSGDLCDTCRWWDEFTTRTGFCRRHAPRPGEAVRELEWPETSADDWCGEHEPIPEPEPVDTRPPPPPMPGLPS